MMNPDAADRWAKDLYGRFVRCEVTGKRVVELFSAITPEAREDLLVTVRVGLDELEDAYRFERDFMPPCEFKYLRWLAIFLHAPEVGSICEFNRFVTDGAWECGCRSCTEFSRRVDAGIRRFVA